MSEATLRTGDRAPAFELPNVGVGPDPLSLSYVRETADYAVVLLLRDYHCPKCKAQVQTLAEHAERFDELNAAVLPILPESRERAATWQERFDLPFPLLADPEKTVAEEYDQPTRFGPLGRLHDFVGRMPESLVIDTREGNAEVVYTYEGSTPGDRPAVDTLVEEVSSLGESFVFGCELVEC